MSDPEVLAAKRMQMLRLARGWSQEELAQESAREGIASLNRPTIGKIESDVRPIRAGEAEGVARVFGLTSSDLLDPRGPSVFLSYAEQDDVPGHEVATWLNDHGFQVLSLNQGEPGNQTPVSRAHDAIDAADAVVVLLSPGFQSSPRCREELEAADRRAQQILAAGAAPHFIHVLQVEDTADLDTSRLQGYPLTDLVLLRGRKREAALRRLGGRIILGSRATIHRPDPATRAQGRQAFLDRRDELERILHGLSSLAGPHFWLVISPPGLGKTWFLRRLAVDAAEAAPVTWITKTVDLRVDAADCLQDAMAVVRKLFDSAPPPSPEPANELLRIAQEIIRSGRPCLCLLDGAELLPASTATELRQYLSQIYRLVEDAGNGEARLAFVVASRHDGRWRGVTPYPRLSVLPLAEFDAATVQGALESLALRMRRVHTSTGLREDAVLVRSASEGLPALVQQSLEWISAEEWLAIDRLNSPQLFKEIIKPYIRSELLTRDALLPTDRSGKPDEQLAALVGALRGLAPYRFFTMSHVRHHQKSDSSFAKTLEHAHWSIEDLWQAVSGCALLSRPLDEPWHEIYPAIRRLLYRYFYETRERAEAHRRACEFTEVWADKQTGRDQVIGLVECIWHEAARLRLIDAADIGEILAESARMRSLAIRPSPAYTVTELRMYASERMRNDEELRQEVAGVSKVFERLVQIVLAPSAQEA